MKLQVVFQDDSFVDLVLFQNNTVLKWFKHFQCYQENYHLPKLAKSPNHKNIGSDIGNYWNQIKVSINELENIGYRFPLLIADKFDYSQDTLNKLHRFFTYNILWYRDYNNENPFDKDFELPNGITFQNWLDILDKINVSVHYLEQFTIEHENKKFLRDQFSYLNIAFAPPARKSHTDLDSWLDFDDEDQLHNFNEYMSLESPLVILSQSVLGKYVLKSFCENDDPNALDCTGRLGSFGSFEIELDDNRKKFYRSDKFIQWAASYGRTTESLPLEFPIGYLPDPTRQIDLLLRKVYTFKQVKFID
jgi:hypothetical protein